MDSAHGYKLPPTLHHTQSASSIPNTHFSPHFNVNMNGHNHHVGGHYVGYNNNQNGVYNPMGIHNQHPYQSIGYIPSPQQSLYTHHQTYNTQYPQQPYGINNISHLGQNQAVMGVNNINQYQSTNNNNYLYNTMSNQANQGNLNPQNQTLGGYHNQGYGSHQPGQGQSS